MTLRLAFMGTPDFAATALQALIDAGHNIVCVYSQPPKPANRGQKLTPSSVHLLAEQHKIEVRTPRSLKNAEEQEKFRTLNLDFAIVAAYGLILPKAILDAPKYGCLNIHASLLPRWRGAAPIQRAILAGDQETGITIMQMDEGLDTGPMLLKKSVPITNKTTASELHDQLAALGGNMIVEALNHYNQLTPEIQPADGITYAHKLTKEDGRIDWNNSAEQIDRQIRALTPWPGTWLQYNNEVIKVLAVEIVDQKRKSGTLLNQDFTVACGNKALRLLRVQRAGKAPVSGSDFLRGYPIADGTSLS